MTTTAEGLADIIVGLLQAAAADGATPAPPDGLTPASIFGVRAYPTQQDQLPQIQLAMPDEEKLSRGPNGPYFTVRATIPILIEVQAAATEDEAGAAQVRGELLDIARWIETTCIGNPALDGLIQRYVRVKAHGRADGKGEAVTGQRVITMELEFFQAPEDFYVPAFDDLEEIDVNAPLTDLTNPPAPPADWQDTPTSVFTLPTDD